MKPTHQIDYIGIVDDKSMDWNVVFNFIYLFHDFNRKKQPALYFQVHTSKIKKFSGPVGNRTLDLLLV
jgi:hypothetical protein